MTQSSTSPFLIYIVEDDEWYREFLTYTLSLDPDHEVRSFDTAKKFISALGDHPAVVTVDYSLPDSDGAEVLKQVKKISPHTEVIMISEQDKIETALSLLKAGAYDYFEKSADIRDRLLNTIQHIKSNAQLRERITTLERAVSDKHEIRKNIIGESQPMKQVFELIEKSLNNNLTVTITGETGTGKEEVARAIHHNSIFSKGPFIAINMAAIPRDLAESELFGHEKGAFTGAISARAGKFEEAEGGTIFLDEIGDMDPSLQVKLLRVLQEKSVTRVGGNKPIKVNNRVIVATHKNLTEEVKSGAFREDLFYRIYGLTIALPPLRDRGNDIILLAQFFIDRFCRENKMTKKKLSAEAVKHLLSLSWPGNVRELKSLTELACVLAKNEEIAPTDLQPIAMGTSNTSFYRDGLTLDDYTRKIIRHYLDINEQNVATVAGILNIGKTTIYRMMKDEKGI
jgi:two-component system, NtrC family, response regulator AtoC